MNKETKAGDGMMNKRVELLRKKMEEKRKKRKPASNRFVVREKDQRAQLPLTMKHDEEREEHFYTYGDNKQASQYDGQSFFKKDRFIMQVLASICLFFTIGIISQTQSPSMEGVREYVNNSFQNDFQFSAVAEWYEDAFGRPLALIPNDMHVGAPGDFNNDEEIYAMPATGTVQESFQQNGRGIYVETSADATVEAVRSGQVRIIGEDEAGEWGKVVVIRHNDGTESWYGNLENISVQLYETVERGELIGGVTPHEEKEATGVYYFAFRDGDTFIDPSEVISFD
ncbi:M23 family metallopeptidase [Evansella cellulosilytica]|uniref:Peptidase M23 n=1 Tax=Evansella cellulosilytica (strain ATCC 21833 / DSM 2522 / FERM P-1141 / JCM 9156 / N-4) TaxID=649639 RepID=E6TYU5_EVAC2|nr:M23 family metallopeptidase [Evansella cellulosilytica]ADU31280.1 Peptidase M23 [Evansella cellulosilytica DSM 2522]